MHIHSKYCVFLNGFEKHLILTINIVFETQYTIREQKNHYSSQMFCRKIIQLFNANKNKKFRT